MAYTIRQKPASTSNYTKGRAGNKINKIIIHHAATTDFDGIARTFQNPATKISAHYGVGRDNNVDVYVQEADMAWHSGNRNANYTSIGIENVNSTGSPTWDVAESTFNTLVELTRDVAMRNNLLPLVVGKNLFQHKDFKRTFCAGKLGDRLGELANRVNDLLGTPAPAPTPTPAPAPKPAPIVNNNGRVFGRKYINNDPLIGRVASFLRKNYPAYTPASALGNYFGPNIEKSLKEFQRRTGILADGNFTERGETMQMLKRHGFKG